MENLFIYLLFLGVRTYPGSGKYLLLAMIIIFTVLGYTIFTINRKVNSQRKLSDFLKSNVNKKTNVSLDEFNKMLKTKYRTSHELGNFLKESKNNFDNLHCHELSFDFNIKSDRVEIIPNKK